MEGAPKKKGTSGLVILLWVIGIGATVVLLGGGLIVYAVWKSPTGRGVVGIIGQVIAIQTKAMKAPGTKELKQLGCQQAMVMSIEDIRNLFASIDAGPPPAPKGEEPPFDEIVVCSVRIVGTAPTCDAASKTYVAAVGPRARPFLISVNRQGKEKAECAHIRDKDGAFLSDGEDPKAYGPVTQPPAEE